MRLVVSQAAEQLIEERGGRLYVWVKQGHCCGGANRTLSTTSALPKAREFRSAARTQRVEVFLPARMAPLPAELHLEVGRFSRQIRAYWNGCAWLS
jgi:hypothetical protein